MTSPEQSERLGTFRGEVTTEWLMQGAWLSRAWLVFGGPSAAAAKLEEAAFAKLRHGETPEAFLMCSSSLARAASAELDGRSLEEFVWSTPPLPPASHYPEIGDQFTGDVRAAWSKYGSFRYLAETTVYSKLLCGELRAYGSPAHTAAEPCWIPVRTWQDLVRDRSKTDRVLAEGIIYFHVHVVDPNKTKLPESLPSVAMVTAPRNDEITLGGKRGPRPNKQHAVAAAIGADITAGKLTRAELANMLEKNLAHQYGASRDTVRKARKLVLAETSTNSDKS